VVLRPDAVRERLLKLEEVVVAAAGTSSPGTARQSLYERTRCGTRSRVRRPKRTGIEPSASSWAESCRTGREGRDVGGRRASCVTLDSISTRIVDKY
jgi:hypothetical protein